MKVLLIFGILVFCTILLAGCFLGVNKPDGTPATQPSDVGVPLSIEKVENYAPGILAIAGAFGIPFAGLTREWLKNKGLSKAFKDVVSTVQSAKIKLDEHNLAGAFVIVANELKKQDLKTQKLVKKAKETKDA